MRGEAGGQDHMAEAWAGHVRLGGSGGPCLHLGKVGLVARSRAEFNGARCVRCAGRPAGVTWPATHVGSGSAGKAGRRPVGSSEGRARPPTQRRKGGGGRTAERALVPPPLAARCRAAGRRAKRRRRPASKPTPASTQLLSVGRPAGKRQVIGQSAASAQGARSGQLFSLARLATGERASERRAQRAAAAGQHAGSCTGPCSRDPHCERGNFAPFFLAVGRRCTVFALAGHTFGTRLGRPPSATLNALERRLSKPGGRTTNCLLPAPVVPCAADTGMPAACVPLSRCPLARMLEFELRRRHRACTSSSTAAFLDVRAERPRLVSPMKCRRERCTWEGRLPQQAGRLCVHSSRAPIGAIGATRSGMLLASQKASCLFGFIQLASEHQSVRTVRAFPSLLGRAAAATTLRLTHSDSPCALLSRAGSFQARIEVPLLSSAQLVWLLSQLRLAQPGQRTG